MWGEGDGSLFDWSDDALWQVIRIDGKMVDLRDKVKIEKGYVVFTGTRKDATDKIISLGATGPVIGCYKSGGYSSKLCGGYSTVEGGSYSTVKGGYSSTVSGGYDASVAGDIKSVLSLDFYKDGRKRIIVAYVGENRIEPNVFYKLDERGNFVREEAL